MIGPNPDQSPGQKTDLMLGFPKARCVPKGNTKNGPTLLFRGLKMPPIRHKAQEKSTRGDSLKNGLTQAPQDQAKKRSLMKLTFKMRITRFSWFPGANYG